MTESIRTAGNASGSSSSDAGQRRFDTIERIVATERRKLDDITSTILARLGAHTHTFAVCEALATASPTVTTTVTDLAGASVTFTTTVPNTVVVAHGHFDCESNGSVDGLVGQLRQTEAQHRCQSILHLWVQVHHISTGLLRACHQQVMPRGSGAPPMRVANSN